MSETRKPDTSEGRLNRIRCSLATYREKSGGTDSFRMVEDLLAMVDAAQDELRVEQERNEDEESRKDEELRDLEEQLEEAQQRLTDLEYLEVQDASAAAVLDRIRTAAEDILPLSVCRHAPDELFVMDLEDALRELAERRREERESRAQAAGAARS